MEKFIKKLCDRYELIIQKEFTEGYNSEGVFKVIDKNGTPFVLKAAIGNKVLVEEIKMNKTSYEKILNLDLNQFVPNIIHYEATEEFAFILMEYCGENFYEFIKNAKCPIKCYLLLTSELEKVYIKSKKENNNGKKMILRMIKLIEELYEKYICIIFDKQKTLANQLRNIESSFNLNALKFCCFSDWDLKPDDVYLTDSGIKYSDPRNNIVGIPIVDIGSFAGLIKIYNFPEADNGYEILKKFAIEKIAKILFIQKYEAIKIFNLGRLFQCFMSARFRFESNPKSAHEAFINSKLYIEKII